jgi:hypothetical protein
MDLDEALRIIAAGSSHGSPDEFEAAVVVVARAAQRVADIERRARQVVTGFNPDASPLEVARFIVGDS